MQSYAMEEMTKDIRDMCEGRKNDTIAYHCNALKKFFYCAKVLNMADTVDKKEAAADYCDHVYDYNRESRITGLPNRWALSYHVKKLADASGKDPEEIVNCIHEANIALHKFHKSETYESPKNIPVDFLE